MSISEQDVSVARRCCCSNLFTFPSSSLEQVVRFQLNFAKALLGEWDLRLVKKPFPLHGGDNLKLLNIY